MLLYRTQPKSVTTSNIINLKTKEDLLNSIGDVQSKFGSKSIHANDITTLLTDGCVVDGMLTLSGYQNILVVTSFENGMYDRLRDNRYRAIKSAGDHMMPIIHKVNGSEGNIYVTKVRNSENYYEKLYQEFDIPFVEVDSYFRLDGDFKISTSVKFDAVVLLGCESFKRGKFSASDIKKKFARYCVEGFDLIDVYRNDRRKITGGTKSIDTQLSKMIENVNTPKKVYDVNTKVNERDFDEEFGDVYMKHKLMYRRLALNIETMKQYYRVF